MREPLATLDLDDGDIVGVAVAPIQTAPESSVPPPAPSIPPPPVSHVVARVREVVAVPTPVPTLAFPVAAGPAPRARPVASEAPALLRLSISDPTDLVFDGMHGLSFARSPGEAADMCAETLAKALGARTVVVHAHDLVSGELRAIGAHGDGDFDIIGSAEPSEDDLVASAVICNQRSVTMTFDGELSRLAPKRLHAVGSPRTLVAAPAMSWGRCLAIVEVIDADERYAARVVDSATYVAERLAQFLSARAA